MSLKSVRDALSTQYHREKSTSILYDGMPIGCLVSYGKHRTPGGTLKTVYASRIYQTGMRIQLEAGRSSALLNKVAAEINRAIHEGRWTPPRPGAALLEGLPVDGDDIEDRDADDAPAGPRR